MICIPNCNCGFPVLKFSSQGTPEATTESNSPAMAGVAKNRGLGIAANSELSGRKAKACVLPPSATVKMPGASDSMAVRSVLDTVAPFCRAISNGVPGASCEHTKSTRSGEANNTGLGTPFTNTWVFWRSRVLPERSATGVAPLKRNLPTRVATDPGVQAAVAVGAAALRRLVSSPMPDQTYPCTCVLVAMPNELVAVKVRSCVPTSLAEGVQSKFPPAASKVELAGSCEADSVTGKPSAEGVQSKFPPAASK